MDNLEKIKEKLLKSPKIEFSDCCVFNQIAGHGAVDSRLTFLSYPKEGKEAHRYLLKPAFSRGQLDLKEAQFYNYLSTLNSDNVLKQFTPDYFGTAFVPQDRLVSQYFLKLENISTKSKIQCSMDVKIGTKTYSPDDTPQKIKQVKEKYVFQEEIAFRICGMKVFDLNNGALSQHKKSDWGRTVNPDNLINSLKLFFDCGLSKAEIKKIIEKFLFAAGKLKKYFEEQMEFGFRSSSLLLLYSRNEIRLKMVDFCHVQSASNKIDFGYLKGISNFIEKLEFIDVH
ncbi:hypothetical protein MHBO_002428, partial [Bonamia ostreae]